MIGICTWFWMKLTISQQALQNLICFVMILVPLSGYYFADPIFGPVYGFFFLPHVCEYGCVHRSPVPRDRPEPLRQWGPFKSTIHVRGILTFLAKRWNFWSLWWWISGYDEIHESRVTSKGWAELRLACRCSCWLSISFFAKLKWEGHLKELGSSMWPNQPEGIEVDKFSRVDANVWITNHTSPPRPIGEICYDAFLMKLCASLNLYWNHVYSTLMVKTFRT